MGFVHVGLQRNIFLHGKEFTRKLYPLRMLNLYQFFIGFTKAFDSIDWNYIENILLTYEVPKEIVDVVICMFILM